MTVARSLVLVLAVGVISASARAAERPPNVVFFLVDDLGWRDLGCYGSGFYETPHIDAFAAQGVRFTQAYAACHVCSPTRASIMTGKYPAELQLTDWLPGRKDFPFQKLKNAADSPTSCRWKKSRWPKRSRNTAMRRGTSASGIWAKIRTGRCSRGSTCRFPAGTKAGRRSATMRRSASTDWTTLRATT